MTADLSKTCRIGPCRRCGESFASNDPAARVCGDGTCDVDDEGVDGVKGGQGRTARNMVSAAEAVCYAILGALALFALVVIYRGVSAMVGGGM